MKKGGHKRSWSSKGVPNESDPIWRSLGSLMVRRVPEEEGITPVDLFAGYDSGAPRTMAVSTLAWLEDNGYLVYYPDGRWRRTSAASQLIEEVA